MGMMIGHPPPLLPLANSVHECEGRKQGNVGLQDYVHATAPSDRV